MGRTPFPLTIVLHSNLMGPQFRGLQEQGHTVLTYEEATAAKVPYEEVDLFLGPQCRWFTRSMLKYLDTTLKAARDTVRAKRANAKEATV